MRKNLSLCFVESLLLSRTRLWGFPSLLMLLMNFTSLFIVRKIHWWIIILKNLFQKFGFCFLCSIATNYCDIRSKIKRLTNQPCEVDSMGECLFWGWNFKERKLSFSILCKTCEIKPLVMVFIAVCICWKRSQDSPWLIASICDF